MELPWSAAKANAAAVEEPTRAEIIEALLHMVHAARREFPVVGTEAAPTPWDRRHWAIDDLLYDLELSE